MPLVEVRFLSRSQINRTKTGEDLTSINSNFDLENELRPVACTKTEPKNDLFLHCRRKPKQLSKKELSNVAPASVFLL